MTYKFSLSAVAILTAVYSSSAMAGAETLSEAYKASLMERCVANGGLQPELVEKLNEEEFLKALTDCAKRNVVAKPAPAPVYELAEPSYAPSPSHASAPRYSVPQELASAGSSVGSSGSSIGDILSGNVFGRGRGQGGGLPPVDPGPVGPGPAGPGPAAPGPAAPANPIDARLKSIETAIDKGIQSGAIMPDEAAKLGAQLQVAKGINANLGDTGEARLRKQLALDRLAAATNDALHNTNGIPSPDINTFRSAKAGKGLPGAPTIDPKTGKPIAGTPQTLQQKLAEKMSAKVDPKTGKPIAGTPQTLQQKLAERMSAKVDPKTGKPIAGTPQTLQQKLAERMSAKVDPKTRLQEVMKKGQTASVKSVGNQTLRHNGSSKVFAKPAHVNTSRVQRPIATLRTVTHTHRATVKKGAPG